MPLGNLGEPLRLLLLFFTEHTWYGLLALIKTTTLQEYSVHTVNPTRRKLLLKTVVCTNSHCSYTKDIMLQELKLGHELITTKS